MSRLTPEMATGGGAGREIRFVCADKKLLGEKACTLPTTDNSIQCLMCTDWVHFKCAGIEFACKKRDCRDVLNSTGVYFVCGICRRDFHERLKSPPFNIKKELGALEAKFKAEIEDLAKVFKDELAIVSNQIIKNTNETKVETCDDSKVKFDDFKTILKDELNKTKEIIEVANSVQEEIVTQVSNVLDQNTKIVDTMQARTADIVHQPDGGWNVARSRNVKRKLARHESNTLIIKAKEGQIRDELYEEEMCKVVKSKLKDVKIDKMRFTPNKSVILNLPDSESIEKAKNALQDNDKVTANNTKKAHPKIMIPYVPLMELGDPASEEDKTEFVHSILIKNANLNGYSLDDIKIINIRKAKQDKYRHVILRCSPKIRNAIYQNYNKIYTTYGHYEVHDNYYVRICNFCQGYGHIEKDCKKNIDGKPPTCGKCAGEHRTNTCNCDKRDFRCSQCIRRNLSNDRNHAVFDHKCQAHKEQVRRLAENTEHGY